MPGAKLLIVEDDSGVSKLLTVYLEGEGFAVTVAGSVADMQQAFQDQEPAGVILDVMLPDGDGWGALRWLRARSQLPVIMLTGKADTVDKVVGLELGADDYLAKPFDLRELLARLRTILRRHEVTGGKAIQTSMPDSGGDRGSGELRFPGLAIDLGAQLVRDEQGTILRLTQAEYRILLLLVRAPGSAVTRGHLMKSVAGRDWDPNDRSIDVHVSNLRRKLETALGRAGMIRTVRGAGYMFIPSGD